MQQVDSEVNFVFELPADRFARCGRAHSEQNAGVPSETAGPEVGDEAEQLRADPVVLRPVRIEPLKGARVAIGLKARLDRRAEREPRFPGVQKERLLRRGRADFLLYEQVYRVDRAEDFLAEHRPDRELARVTPEYRPAELGEEAGIQPILAALGELKEVFRGDLVEIERLSG